MDFMKALTYPFEDDDWLKKIGIAALVQFLPIIGSPIALSGWSWETSRRVRNGEATPLAGWDEFGERISKGLILFLGQLVYQIPVFIFICIGYAPLLIAGASGDSDAMESIGTLGIIVMSCCYCLAFLYALAATVVYWGGYIRFIDKPEFSTFMQFRDNIALVRENVGDFGMTLVYLLLGGLIAGVASSVTLGLGALLMTPFMMYFSGHLLGQLAAKVLPGVAPALG